MGNPESKGHRDRPERPGNPGGTALLVPAGRLQRSPARANRRRWPGYVYPTEGGAARVAQPVPEPVPEPIPAVAPRPVAAPVSPAAPLRPDVQALLATTATTSGLGTLATLGGPQVQPVMPAGLTRTQQELWRTCNQQHNTYKATQDEAAAYAARTDPLRQRLMQNQASLQDRIDFCALLDERIRLVQRLHSERLRYMRLNCDQFDWFSTGTTQVERIAGTRGNWTMFRRNCVTSTTCGIGCAHDDGERAIRRCP